MRRRFVLGFLLLAAGVPGAETGPRPDTVAGLIQKLEAKDERVQLTAVRQLGRLGVAAREAVPALTRVLHAPPANARNQAAQALAQIGAPAVPALVDALKDRDPATRLRAARALAQVGPEAKEAVPALIDALRDKGVDVRVGAVDALGEMGPDAKAAAAPLARLLRGKSARVREHVAVALVQVGPTAIGPLCEALEADDAEGRLDALRALTLFGSEAKRAVPVLRKALTDDDPRIRAAAAAALGQMEADAQDAIPDLLEALKEKNPEVRKQVANALVLMSMAGVPGLLQQIRKHENRDRWVAAAVQAHAAAREQDPLTPWLKDLTDKDPQVRVRAALVLGGMGPQAQRALPALGKALGDENDQVRLAAAMAIARVQKIKAEANLAAERIMRAIKARLDALQPPGTRSRVLLLQARQFVMTYVILAVMPRVKGPLTDLHDQMEGEVDALGAGSDEAIPALVDGMNFVALYEVGDL